MESGATAATNLTADGHRPRLPRRRSPVPTAHPSPPVHHRRHNHWHPTTLARLPLPSAALISTITTHTTVLTNLPESAQSTGARTTSAGTATGPVAGQQKTHKTAGAGEI